MAKIKLNGDTSGYIEISAPAVSGNNTLELGPGTKILTNLDNTFTGITTFSNGIHITSGGFILNQQRSDTHASLIIDKPDAGTGTLKFFNNGSASAYIQHTNSEHLNYYLPSGSGSQVFYTNGSERLRITSDGKVGIGIDNPARGGLHIHKASTAELHLTDDTTGSGSGDGLTIFSTSSSAGVWYRENANLRFATNNTERMIITSAGTLQPAGDIKLTKSSDPRIYANTNVGVNIDGMALYLNRYVDAHVVSNMGGSSFGIGAVPVAGDGGNSNYNNWGVPKLHVQGDSGNGKFHLLGRFVAGSDADNTGAQIVIHHGNDRGMALQGGRSVSNRSYGAIKALDNLAREATVMDFRGENGQGVDYIKFYTGNSNSTTEQFKIDSSGRITKPNQPCAMAYNAQGQHMAGASVAQFNSTRFNIGNMYNSSNGRMTVPVAGRYLVAYSGLHDYVSQNAIGFDIRINGSAFNGGEGYQEDTSSSNSQLSKTLILDLSANDYVDIYIRQSGTQVHQRYGSFSMCLIT